MAPNLDIYRMLPCPYVVAFYNFGNLKLEPPQIDQVFDCIAIGPNLNDIHALACVGMMRDQDEATIEILQSLAVSDHAYRALCEAIRSLYSALQVENFVGTINMVSTVMPMRITEMKPFYEAKMLSLETGSEPTSGGLIL